MSDYRGVPDYPGVGLRRFHCTTKYPCIDCAIYQMNIQLGAKIEIEIYRYQKFVLLAFTWEKIVKFF